MVGTQEWSGYQNLLLCYAVGFFGTASEKWILIKNEAPMGHLGLVVIIIMR